ncbi:helix-turn-helix domain-containing protein [Phenylobacterium sp. LH3H17]|uniref:helix-turn-helix domain-containing protein n=1 Tax=Phenylobacterium sp. LH3H17 TaxID=2903901 RepID=UPI0020C96ED3|nr:helix-turn-helix transcriptional regulator [Phenylobacterium sp. LH3H17]UTP39748.1 helix-turn-helix domain-containing protein [Phenylobacterium sp. LH3H17]
MPVSVRLKGLKPDLTALQADTALSARLRLRRRELGLLQVEAARLMGVNEWTYTNWEKAYYEPLDRFYPAIIGFLGYEPWPEPTTLGEALQAERRRRGLPVKRAAALVGVDEGTWSRWERGEWKPMTRARDVIDAFLQLSTKAVFPGEVR